MKPPHVTVAALLADRGSLLEWVEPASSACPAGVVATATIYSRASVEDCIGMQRYTHCQTADDPPCKLSDRELLLDFMAVHWAVPVAGK